MRKSKKNRPANSRWIICALLALFPSFATALRPWVCGGDTRLAAQRVFATARDSDAWREYRNIAEATSSETESGASAELWRGTKGTLMARTVEPGEDFWTYTSYCFGGNGQLRSVAFEVRTAWGWSYRQAGAVRGGLLRASTSGFFDTRTGKSISRPAAADDVPDALKPKLYVWAKQLPFAKLLTAQPGSGSTPTTK